MLACSIRSALGFSQDELCYSSLEHYVICGTIVSLQFCPSSSFFLPFFLPVKMSTCGFASVVLLSNLFPIMNTSVHTWSKGKWRWGNVFPSDQWISDVTLNRWLSNAEIHIWIKEGCVCVCRNAFFSLRDSSQYRKMKTEFLQNGGFILTKYFFLLFFYSLFEKNVKHVESGRHSCAALE